VTFFAFAAAFFAFVAASASSVAFFAAASSAHFCSANLFSSSSRFFFSILALGARQKIEPHPGRVVIALFCFCRVCYLSPFWNGDQHNSCAPQR
jgi:hypothetical protein